MGLHRIDPLYRLQQDCTGWPLDIDSGTAPTHCMGLHQLHWTNRTTWDYMELQGLHRTDRTDHTA